MKKNKIILSFLISSILFSSTSTFAATTRLKSSADNTSKVTNPLKNTRYKWSTTSYTSPYKWYKVMGPEDNDGDFSLGNWHGGYFRTLHLSWSADQAVNGMKIKIYNNWTGGSVVHTVNETHNETYFTDLRNGKYSIYVLTKNWNVIHWYIRTEDETGS